MNGIQLTSWEALRAGIVSTTKALLKNPWVWVIAGVTSTVAIVTQLAQVEEEVAQKAQELGESFKTTKLEIEDYKTQIEDIYKTINDSGSSITEVTTARQNLMSVQDELIDKFGDEESAINNITDAINGQVDALNNLTKSEWEDSKINFESSGEKWYDKLFNGVSNWFNDYDDNYERMFSKMENAHSYDYGIIRLEKKVEEENKDWFNELNHFEEIWGDDFNFDTNNNAIQLSADSLEEYIERLKQLRRTAEETGASSKTISDLSDQIKNAEKDFNQYKNFYDQYILYEEILPDDSKNGAAQYYDTITEAYQEYQKALASGDEDAIEKAMEKYSEAMSAIEEPDSGLSNRVKGFFEDMYPDLQQIFAEWKFEVDFEPKKNGEKSDLEKEVTGFLDDFGTKKGNKDSTVTDEELLNLDKTSEEYEQLETWATEYGLSVEQLIEKLKELGHVKDAKYQELLNNPNITEEQLESLPDEDLKYAYEIEDVGELTFKELQEAIKKAKEEANKVELNIDSYKTASESISSLATAFKELTDNEYISLETISKIKEAVGDSISNWDAYEQKLLSVKKGTAEYNQLMSELTYATLKKQLGGVNALVQADEKRVAQLLKENGVLNHVEVSQNVVARAKAEAYVQSQENNNISEKTIKSLIDEANAAGISTNAYLELTTKEILFNDNKLETSEKCKQILAIAKTAGIASTAYSTLQDNINEWASKDLLGSGTRTQTAKDAGMTVISEKERKDKNHKGKGNLYVASDGKEFEKYEDAMYYQEALNNVQKISDAYSNINFVLPDYSGNGGSSKETKESFNWIETALSRIQRTITNLGKTVSATYRSWADRNKALKDEISAVNQEIDLQDQAYRKYLSLAESVNLSDDYKRLVREGAIRYDDESIDSDTADKIQKYQEYYEAALDAYDAKSDLQDQLAQLARQEFDNVAKQFDDQISDVEQNISLIESYIDQAEASGHMVSKSYYSSLIKEGNDNLTLLQTKYDELSEKMSNGVIQEGSEEWYSMSAEIKNVRQAIVEAQTALIEYQNAMDELDWEAFEKMQDRISQITEESDFLIDLMSNDKLTNEDGSLTDQGQATLGLHAANYNMYMAQADEYAKKIEEINEKLAKDPNNQILLDQKQEYIDLQRESILAAEDTKQSMKDVMSECYDSMLSYMDDLINKRKELLQATKDLYDYEKNVSEQTEEIARLQKILDSFNGDTSEEAKASIQKYTVELKDAQEALEETEYDKYISDQEQMLDEMYSVAEEWVNQRLDNLDGLIQGVIDETNASAGSIKDTLISVTGEVGTTLSTAMNDIWSPSGTFGSVVAGYGSELSKLTTISETLNGIRQSIDAEQNEADNKANQQIQQPQTQPQTPTTTPTTAPAVTNTQPTTAKTIAVGGKINAGSAKIYDYAGDNSGERQYYRNDPIYTVLGEKNGYLKVRHHKLSSGITGWFKKSDVKAYKNGGLVDYTGLAQLDGTPSRPELVLNANDTKNFIALTDTLRNIPINAAIQMQNYHPGFTNSGSTGNFTINGVTLEFPNVKDANDFITELQHSKRFENIIHEIAFSKHNLSKYKY